MAQPNNPQDPDVSPADAPDDFEAKQEKFGAAYAALADGLRGEGINRAVKVTRYLLAAFAAFVVLAAIVASL